MGQGYVAAMATATRADRAPAPVKGGLRRVGGGNARFPHFAFGSLVGFGMGWVYWLGSVTLAPVEVEAALQYADKYINDGVGFHVVHEVSGQTVLTAPGYGVAAVLM